ncbi:MAG: cytochrome C [Thermodesulfobacteriota bacterium]
MKKRYQRGMLVTSLTAAALLFAASQAQSFSHNNVTLRDASGNAIAAIDTNGDGTADAPPAAAPAFSAQKTCGAVGCHDYQAIERHSYHAQLGANEISGWNAWTMGNWNSIATKGKPWVQSPGHVGKW